MADQSSVTVENCPLDCRRGVSQRQAKNSLPAVDRGVPKRHKNNPFSDVALGPIPFRVILFYFSPSKWPAPGTASTTKRQLISINFCCSAQPSSTLFQPLRLPRPTSSTPSFEGRPPNADAVCTRTEFDNLADPTFGRPILRSRRSSAALYPGTSNSRSSLMLGSYRFGAPVEHGMAGGAHLIALRAGSSPSVLIRWNGSPLTAAPGRVCAGGKRDAQAGRRKGRGRRKRP
jgi:hypothetical protein